MNLVMSLMEVYRCAGNGVLIEVENEDLERVTAATMVARKRSLDCRQQMNEDGIPWQQGAVEQSDRPRLVTVDAVKYGGVSIGPVTMNLRRNGGVAVGVESGCFETEEVLSPMEALRYVEDELEWWWQEVQVQMKGRGMEYVVEDDEDEVQKNLETQKQVLS